MNEATEKQEYEIAASELDTPHWSVVSFDKCEGAGLTYHAAAKFISEKEESGVYGLCIITDDAASRIKSRS